MDDLLNTLYGNLEESKQLLTAVSCNMLDRLDYLLGAGTDVNSKVMAQGGDKALHVAARKGHHKCMEKLLHAGANPDIPNDFGITPLSVALRQGQVECVKLLLCTGSVLSDPRLTWTSQQPMNNTPVWTNYNAEMIKLLLIATPDMAELGPDIQTLLYDHYIKTVQNTDLLKMYSLTGNPLSSDQLASIIGQTDEDTVTWLRSFQGVHSLQHYARLAIRHYLRPNVLFGAKILPLPIKLQECLVFQEGS